MCVDGQLYNTSYQMWGSHFHPFTMIRKDWEWCQTLSAYITDMVRFSHNMLQQCILSGTYIFKRPYVHENMHRLRTLTVVWEQMFNRVIWTFTLQPENLYYICRPSKWQMHWLHVGQLFFILPWKLEVVSQPVQGMYQWKCSWWFGSKIRNNSVDRNGHIPRSLVHSVWLQQVPPDRYEHLWWKPFELDERCAKHAS